MQSQPAALLWACFAEAEIDSDSPRLPELEDASERSPRATTAEDLERELTPLSGESPKGLEASAVVRALVAAARSIILYDAGNQAVADFLSMFRTKVEAFLGRHGDLALEIRPWDMTFAGEVVYLERDRERSLSLRLYRDGVRRITVQPGATWEELAQLVTILAVRFKGIRQQEEDAATLLWRASFTHIKVDTVIGFAAEEDDEIPLLANAGDGVVAPASAAQAAIFSAPYEFSYPWPEHAERGRVGYRPLAQATLDGFAGEDSDGHVPQECVTLVGELLRAIGDPVDRLEAREIAPVLREVRDYLLSSGHQDALLELIDRVAGLPADAGEARTELLAACLDNETLEQMVRVVSDHSNAGLGVARLDAIAGLLGPDHVEVLLRLEATTEPAALSPHFPILLEGALRAHPQVVRTIIERGEGELPARLLLRLHGYDAPTALETALELLAAAPPPRQLAALEILKKTSYSARIGRALVSALAAEDESVRLSALQLLVRQHEHRAFAPLLARVNELATEPCSEREAGACGAALALLDPDQALRAFSELVRPGGLRRFLPRHPLQLHAAVSALARLPGGEAEELLAWLAEHAGGAVAERAAGILARRRAEKESAGV